MRDYTLSERELEVARELRAGNSNKVIAYNLGVAESTVKVHVRHIMQKLNVTNRTQAVLKMMGEKVPERERNDIIWAS